MNNISLKYSPEATKVGFANIEAKFVPNNTPTLQDVYNLANARRGEGFVPVFPASDCKFVPCSKNGINEANVTISALALTTPPDQKEKTYFVEAILLGVGVFAITKLLS
jgi:hypothetical protein